MVSCSSPSCSATSGTVGLLALSTLPQTFAPARLHVWKLSPETALFSAHWCLRLYTHTHTWSSSMFFIYKYIFGSLSVSPPHPSLITRMNSACQLVEQRLPQRGGWTIIDQNTTRNYSNLTSSSRCCLCSTELRFYGLYILQNIWFWNNKSQS